MNQDLLELAKILGLPVVGMIISLITTRLTERWRERWQESESLIRNLAALRSEFDENLVRAQKVLDSLNYLWTESFRSAQKNGYLFYLDEPVRLKVLQVYDEIYTLSEISKARREQCSQQAEPRKSQEGLVMLPLYLSVDEDAHKDQRDIVMEGLQELVNVFDKRHPEIVNRFRKRIT